MPTVHNGMPLKVFGGGAGWKNPSTFIEAMSLPVNEQWRAASDTEAAGLEANNAYILTPATSVRNENKVIGFP